MAGAWLGAWLQRCALSLREVAHPGYRKAVAAAALRSV
jgi:hypothetical protein